THLSVEEAKIFVPAAGQQQFCISSIVVDRDSNLYYKNDSGYVFAFGRRTFTLKKTSITLKRGKSYKVAVKSMKPKVTVKYKSKNKKIATVSKKGVIKAKKKGKTVISATANGITRKITVKVK
ncbi:MAG: Ig-like domain-containing protein, partial [Eubacterium sp.]|nr:Ig-like domain-containing protein [Eubacterium sp.]